MNVLFSMLLNVVFIVALSSGIVQHRPASVFSPNLALKLNTKIHFNTHPPTTNFFEGYRHSKESRFVM